MAIVLNTYLFWLKFPFIRYLFFFISGLLTACHFSAFLYCKLTELLVGFFLLTFLYVFLFFYLQNKGRRPLVMGMAGLVWFYLFGVLYSTIRADQYRPAHILNNEGIQSYQARIIEGPVQKKKSVYYLLDTQWQQIDHRWGKASGKVLLYVSGIENESSWVVGDEILVNGAPMEFTPPKNPGEFDYKKYMATQRAYHRHFKRTEEITLVGHTPLPVYIRWANRAGQYASGIVNEQLGLEEKAIAFALLLGIKDELSTEMREDYADAGAMHVMAVSGLHVGIIYLMMNWLFRPMKRGRWKWMPAALTIGGLWFYAIVTGLSASVMRSVTMFTMIALAELLNRKSNIYNTLAVAAFILLLYEPLMLFMVGFQLSFLAVWGIVYFQRAIYQGLSVNNKFLDGVWKLSSVGIAAQLATFPLGLYFFHQFPVYFLLSNLVVIPCATVILVLGVLLLGCHGIPWLPVLIKYAFSWAVIIMNRTVSWISELPGSTVDLVEINGMQVALLYAGIIVGIWFVHKRQMKIFYLFMLVVFGFIGLDVYSIYSSADEVKVVIYSLKKGVVVDVYSKREVITYEYLPGDAELDYTVKPARSSYYVRRVRPFRVREIFEGGDLMVFNGRSLLIVRKKPPPGLQIPGKIDYLVVSNNALRGEDGTFINDGAGNVVVLANNYLSVSRSWEKVMDPDHFYSAWDAAVVLSDFAN